MPLVRAGARWPHMGAVVCSVAPSVPPPAGFPACLLAADQLHRSPRTFLPTPAHRGLREPPQQGGDGGGGRRQPQGPEAGGGDSGAWRAGRARRSPAGREGQAVEQGCAGAGPQPAAPAPALLLLPLPSPTPFPFTCPPRCLPQLERKGLSICCCCCHTCLPPVPPLRPPAAPPPSPWQLERKGFFICDRAWDAAAPAQPIVLINIPDGRARVFPGMPAP